MRQPKLTASFKKDMRRQKRRGKSAEKLQHAMQYICCYGDAPERCRPHDLTGNWVGYRECHVAPDWLLVYQVREDIVVFYRTGTHADISG